MQRGFRGYLNEVGCAALLISHKFDHAMLLADEAAVLHNGRIVQKDKPTRLLRSPMHAAVVRVLGWTNVWQASIPHDIPGVIQTSIGTFPLPYGFEAPATIKHLAYCVPHEAMLLGKGTPGIEGIVEAAIPSQRVLRVVLRFAEKNSVFEIGLPLEPEILESVRSGRTVNIKWAANEARILNDD
jgi:ABC-type sulfate/molybdate transport systems ATPase subunit